MGNKQSSPAQPAPQQLARPAAVVSTASMAPPPTPGQQCAVNKVSLNQKLKDVADAQALVDTCDPQAAAARQLQDAIAANIAYVENKKSKMNDLLQNNAQRVKIYRDARDAIAPIISVGTDVSEQAKKLKQENRRLTNSQRKERRNFMDSGPLKGVGGSPGVHTSDDYVMLVFWLAFSLAFGVGLTHFFTTVGASMNRNEKISTGVGAALVAYGFVYYLITMYG